MYRLKYLKYKKKYLELKNYNLTGGFILDKDINVCETGEELKDRIKKLKDSNTLADNMLGKGEFGSVYLLTETKVIKLFEKLDDYEYEKFINEKLSSLPRFDNLFKSHEMCTKVLNIDGEDKEYGIIVMENLKPLNLILQLKDANYETTLDDINLKNFAYQIVSIYAILHYFSNKLNKTIIHNDFKFDNLMLKEIITTDEKYVLKLGAKEIEVPYINYSSKKYKLVLIDFGEAYYSDSDIIKDKLGYTSIKYEDNLNKFDYILKSDLRQLDYMPEKNIIIRIISNIYEYISQFKHNGLF